MSGTMISTATSAMMVERLKTLALAGRIRQLDLQFARLVADLGGRPELVLGAALTCFELGRGHVCLPLEMLTAGSLRPFGLDPQQSRDLLQDLADPARWPALFAASPLVGTEQDEGLTPRWPLRLWHGRLYLTRYHDFELGVARHLRALSERAEWPEIASALSRLFARDYGLVFAALLKARLAPDFSARHFIEKYLDLVFPSEVDWLAIEGLLASAQAASDLSKLDALVPEALCCNGQKLAAATAAARPFAVISGGPGTGKTTTVAKLLAILVETGLQAGKAPAIRLVAPTGKAAARLTESIGSALQALDLPPEWVEAIPTEAGTLHRLLGVIPGRSQFRHHAGNPLHLDLLVVDEASMVDLPMMARLLDALPSHARLILLGDKDQLASVEAGAVLGDICSFIEQGISPAQADWLSRQTGYRLQGTPAGAPVRDSLCLLSKSWRFDQHSGIGQLARACNSGDATAVEAVWGAGFADISLHPWAGEAYDALIAQGVAGYGSYLKAARAGEAPAAVFKAFNSFQILCALRDGPFGVLGLNERLELALSRAGLIARDGDWYAGRPVMVVRNDHGVGLYNGDMGLCLPDESGRLKVWFEQPDGTLRALLPSRLPPHETVYAMTIHKSQGSEFAHTVLVLPDSPSPLLTRELVYTGITRAKARLDLYGDRALLTQAVRKKTERYSGLAERLGE
ncbi:exodeoxyribonuclease V subunit alpha [Aeromonas veronii]|uniref:RecBCD enzyme subunit RecD n=1 Tax=Aeromonas veronii TaxID=654 RepID=A0ABY3MH90_AERVE|nr:exodeoxyribonuclease V subunit alpha [Aeromonas veronii]RDU79839.1 exodeoxyribonuclease V subunit alpha [Aeromonas veronii]RDU80190.1 exodeoxyribonuclease V subunit alpha [Aeromonas veronii]RDU80535.1 exodeoxyribonuclease V subunit alpha [Aeromonas veronii]RDU92236.1 exodeoxyribonuclease V subunit alpha [Aeromonas veronii]TEY45972.1 exodeoxyribonuclease V subunit alpha [Aeromonas veronii]